HQVGAGESSGQGVVVDHHEPCPVSAASVADRGQDPGGLGADAASDDRPGDGTEDGEPNRATDLLAGGAQAGGGPESVSATRDMATRVSGRNSRPRPAAVTSIGPRTPLR